MKSTKSLRSLYPFYGKDEIPSAVADAVSDLVIWVDPDTATPPFKVTARLSNGLVCIDITDASNQYSIQAEDGNTYLFDTSGVLAGHILWDTAGVDVLRATLLANDPQPPEDLYVHPAVCIPRPTPYLSTISVNGQLINDMDIELTADNTITVIREPVGPDDHRQDVSVNLYRNYSNEDTPIHTITIVSDPEEPTEGFSISGDFHVWLKSDAECDIRVVTNDDIIFTEVSNDSL